MSRVTDSTVMSFGKHKGKKMEDIPDSWLIWFYKENKGIMNYIREAIPAEDLK